MRPELHTSSLQPPKPSKQGGTLRLFICRALPTAARLAWRAQLAPRAAACADAGTGPVRPCRPRVLRPRNCVGSSRTCAVRFLRRRCVPTSGNPQVSTGLLIHTCLTTRAYHSAASAFSGPAARFLSIGLVDAYLPDSRCRRSSRSVESPNSSLLIARRLRRAGRGPASRRLSRRPWAS